MSTPALRNCSALLMLPLYGGTLVPDITILVALPIPPSGDLTIPLTVPSDITLPEGLPVYMQVWFQDAGGAFGYSATNGIEADIILSDPLPAPSWITHPSNGMEYALSSNGSFGQCQIEAETHGGNLVTIDGAALNAWLTATFAPLWSRGSTPYTITSGAVAARSIGVSQTSRPKKM